MESCGYMANIFEEFLNILGVNLKQVCVKLKCIANQNQFPKKKPQNQ